VQRILRVGPGFHAYVAVQDPADLPGALACPFCPDGHDLRRHGWYQRWALLPEGPCVAERRVRVRRLLCPRVRRTVSLLPDFCLPRRQYGPEAVGLLLHLYAILRQGLLRAFQRLRPGAVRHSVPQHLVRGFLRRRPELTAYAGGLSPRVSVPPPDLWGHRLEVATLLLPLLPGHPDAAGALRHHGVPFHRRFALGVA
jgi:hypothetical protein